MGPYYRNTSQGMGSFFDSLYQHPVLLVLFMASAIGLGVYLWRKKQAAKSNNL